MDQANHSVTIGTIAIAAASVAAISVISQIKKPKRKPRSMRVNPYLTDRGEKGRFNTAFQDLSLYSPSFKENFHMSLNYFDYIFGKIEHRLKHKKNTRTGDGIMPKEKFAMVLEYLASGSFERHVASNYRVSKVTIGYFISEVCQALCLELGPEFFPVMTITERIRAANMYNEKWNFPNCLGAIDGKHVAIRCPPNAGSLFYNYKQFHSIVLMGIADANYKFSYIDVGAYGSEGNAGVFAACALGKKIIQDNLSLPEDATVYSKELPFFFVADDAFPLCKRIMKPYSPKRGSMLTDEELIFNYLLSRARRCIENAFGILSAKWLCLSRTLFCYPDKAQQIVSACCILHNLLMQNNKESYCPAAFADNYGPNGGFIPGNQSMTSLLIRPNYSNQTTESAVSIRNHLKNYVNSTQGSLEWQRRAVFL